MAENGQGQNNAEDENGDEVFPLGYYVVLLIDVLGQKSKLAEWEREARLGNGQLTEGLHNAIKETAGVVTAMRKMGINFRRGVDATETPPPPFPIEKEVLARFFDREVKTQQFSDTVVFYAPIGNKYQDVALGRVHLMTMLACSLMLSMLAGKNPVRGSLCVGHGIEFGEGDFYGPALARAHYLEDEKAKHPRILVDDSVINLLSQTGKFSQDAMVEAVMQCYAEKIHSLVQCDKDGSRIVDYAGAGLHDILGGDEKAGSVFEAAYAFVCAEREKFWNDPEYRDDSKYDELRERYALVEEYLTERLPLWRGDVAEA